MKTISMTLVALAMTAASAYAQVPGGPTPGCDNSPQRLAANKRVALEFFRPGISGADRVALADPSYKQWNPAFVKGAKEAGMNDYDYFKSRFGGPPAARQGGAGGGGAARQGGPATPPPAGNPTEIVIAECDLVTVVHENFVPDPTAPGQFYARYTFDTFRVGANGKLTEHWDTAVINPPAPAGGRGN
jgi:predicted SnoaL-like aldol condensation-catalyzing enzyme